MNFKSGKALLISAVIAISSVFLPQSVIAGPAFNYGDRASVEYVSCYDGDTCTFNLLGVDPLLGWNISVRIRDIDAPEIRGSCDSENEKALQSREVTRATLAGASQIILRNVSRGKYFRIVAEVEVDGQDLGTILVESNLAVRWSGEGPKHSFCPNEPPGGLPQREGGVQGDSN